MNIFSNFVPNKLVTFDDSNPPWKNDFIKNKIKWKHQIYKSYIKSGRKDSDYEENQNHIALKLNDPMTNTKT